MGVIDQDYAGLQPDLPSFPFLASYWDQTKARL
jgi:hypothetical protein